jgi:DNA-binding LacI/PurR family transcriptional regulator
MSVTLKHIADELGVSQMTVSRALRGVSRISPETRRRVRDTAERLGYQGINGVLLGPAVRNGKGNHTLRVLLPTVSRRIGAEGGAWYLDRMANAVRERLKLSNGRLVEQHFPDIASLAAEWRRGSYHAVVLRQPLPNAWVRELVAIGPVVYAVEFDHQLDVDSVYSNEHRSAAMVLDYLSGFGHEDIVWFGILDRHSPYQVIFDALDDSSVADRQAFSVHGARHSAWANIAYCQLVGQRQPMILVERDWRHTSLDEAVAEGLKRILALDPPPTAIVCSCDPVAIALLAALKRKGMSVPEDVSVVTYGGSNEVKQTDPPLTTVEMPMETIGRVIPELIERRLADANAAPISVQFQTTMYQGRSVARPKKKKRA